MYERTVMRVRTAMMVVLRPVEKLRGFSGSSGESHSTTFEGLVDAISVPEATLAAVVPFNKG